MDKSDRNYTVFFELYGRKMKAKILADNIGEAKKKIKDKIVFHKIIIEKKDIFNQCMNMLDDIVDNLDTIGNK